MITVEKTWRKVNDNYLTPRGSGLAATTDVNDIIIHFYFYFSVTK